MTDSSSDLAPNNEYEREARAVSRTDQRIRVLHVVPAMGVGGLPRVVETLCHTTDPDRFDVRVLSLTFLGGIGEEMREAGYRVDVIPNVDPDRPDRLAPWKVLRYLQKNPVDVVHTHNTQAMMEAIPGALLAGVPNRIHTDHARLYPDFARYIWAERILAKVTTQVVAVSSHTASDLATYQKIPADQIVTIPNGLDGSRFKHDLDTTDLRMKLGLPAEGPVIGLAARLVEQKGIVHLLEALPAILEHFPDLNLLIAGVGDLESSLKKVAVEHGVAEHTHFLGIRRDIPELYSLMDLFMLPSNWEGLPMAVLEAMAAGLPVVGCDVGGVSTAVHDGVNGLLVAPGRSADLAEATISLLSTPDRMKAFGQAAREVFDDHFSAEAMTRAYEDLYVAKR